MGEQFKQFIEAKKIEITLCLLSFTLISLGVYLWRKDLTPTEIQILDKVQDAKLFTQVQKSIFVDVAGQVTNPGVVNLILGARVSDAIASAGGITKEADNEWIAKNLNQAKILADGEKIYIPSRTTENNISSFAKATEDRQNSKININEASESELDKLPGVGLVTATKIINGRPYAKIEELLEKKIVTTKVWEGLKELISAW